MVLSRKEVGRWWKDTVALFTPSLPNHPLSSGEVRRGLCFWVVGGGGAPDEGSLLGGMTVR